MGLSCRAQSRTNRGSIMIQACHWRKSNLFDIFWRDLEGLMGTLWRANELNGDRNLIRISRNRRGTARTIARWLDQNKMNTKS